MKITFIRQVDMQDIFLPNKIKGQVWIDDADKKHLLMVEAVEGRWRLQPITEYCTIESITSYNLTEDDHTHVTGNDTNTIMDSPELEDGQMIVIKVRDTGEIAFLFVGNEKNGSGLFEKYVVCSEMDEIITIGKTPNYDICYLNRFVSKPHAALTVHDGQWSIKNSGRNGTYVNGKAVEEKNLNIGDVVRIFDLCIVIGFNALSINNPNGKVLIHSAKIRHDSKKVDSDTEPIKKNVAETPLYYRMPRFKREIRTYEMRVDPPPQTQMGEDMPLLLALGPSVTMGLASLVTGVYSVVRAADSGNWLSALPTMVMCIGMLLGTVLWPIISKRYTMKKRQEKELLRQNKYNTYLEECAEEIHREKMLQSAILRENFLSPEECQRRIFNRETNIWERGINQNDFLLLRMGSGNVLLDIELKFPEKKFSIYADSLEEKMYKFCTAKKYLENVPITLSLVKNYIISIVGSFADRIQYVNGLVLQMITYYGYDELKLVFIMDEDDIPCYGYTKWLPHVWNEQRNFRYIATNATELKELSAYLEKSINGLEEEEERDVPLTAPNYVIFLLSRHMALRTDVIKRLYHCKKRVNTSVISCVDEFRYAPKEAQVVVQIQNGKGTLLNRETVNGAAVTFTYDASQKYNMEKASVTLANLQLDLYENGNSLPQSYSFMQMMEAGNLKQLNLLKRWEENDPTVTLQTPVGVDALGDYIYLDLHQKYHGPHGLVAGMTGSGKSEFIITYILSMAVNYHPHEVAFVLIDYKGGGMAKTFEKLPHTVGIITNLDGASIKRSLCSIESELRRREEIFANISGTIGSSNIDIYKYQKLYRQKKVFEPLPHLFIISDEFAELKSQQPEFMQQLISAARIGRSLGVHLILATQKPAGVVDEQIWSNSRFRVCLKVQDRTDSMDMLKRPDAASLIETGRFYLQVGYNEIFTLGQSAWAGAIYRPADNFRQQEDKNIVIIDTNAHVLSQGVLISENMLQKQEKQVDAIVSYIEGVAAEEKIKKLTLWQEPLAEHPLIEGLEKQYGYKAEPYILNPIIGELDRPTLQRKELLTLPISENGNTVVYGVAGGGKTSFVLSAIYSIITHHSPEEVNIYLLDFYTESLNVFRNAPHVGDVIFSYEKEKVNKLYRKLKKEITVRRTLLSTFGGDYHYYQRKSTESLPAILVVIHNYSMFREMYADENTDMEYLAREGVKYGVYFIITAFGEGGLRSNLLQNFKQVFALQLNNPDEYTYILGKTNGLMPAEFKGRGLLKAGEILEFQTAYITEDETPYRAIELRMSELQEKWQGKTAQKIVVLPEKVDLNYILERAENISFTSFPIGVSYETAEVVRTDFKKRCMTFIYSAAQAYSSFLRSVLQMIPANEKVLLFDTDGKNADVSIQNVWCASKVNDIKKMVQELFDIAVERNNEWKKLGQPKIIPEKYHDVVIIIPALADLLQVLTGDDRERLELILSKSRIEFKMYFLIGDTVQKTIQYMYSSWYTDNASKADGIWLGDGYASQYNLKAHNYLPQMKETIGEDCGFLITDGVAEYLKFIHI